MLVRPITLNRIQNFRGDNLKPQNNIGKGLVDNSHEIFVEQERIFQQSEFLDYLLHNDIDITTLEHNEKKTKLMNESIDILKKGIKKIKK